MIPAPPAPRRETPDNPLFVIDDAKAAGYAKLELSDEAISRGWINWSDTAILACREIVRLRAEREALIEKVRTLPAPWAVRRQLIGANFYYVGHCYWCGFTTQESAIIESECPSQHPDNGCLWSDVHKSASAPKEPTP